MSTVVHLVPYPNARTPRSACGFNVFPTEKRRIAESVDQVTCELCKRTVAYTAARRKAQKS